MCQLLISCCTRIIVSDKMSCRTTKDIIISIKCLQIIFKTVQCVLAKVEY